MNNDPINAIIIANYQQHDVAELARLVGISPKAVQHRLYDLASSRLIDLARRKPHRRYWTEHDKQTALEMLRSGLGVKDIARAIGKSPKAIHSWIERRSGTGGIAAIRSDVVQVRSARQVSHLLGLPDWKVGRWCEAGYIAYRRNRSGHEGGALQRRADGRRRTRNRTFLITDDALLLFIHDRRYWMLWSPEPILDPDWRDEALDARRRAGGHWLTAQQVGCQLGYADCTVAEWVRRGQLSATQIGHRLYIWSADLERFTPPGEAYLDRRQRKQEHAA